MDFIGRYEHLEDDLRHVLDQVGISAPLELTSEKRDRSQTAGRPDRNPIFTPEMNDRIATVFAREIKQFGYVDRSKLMP